MDYLKRSPAAVHKNDISSSDGVMKQLPNITGYLDGADRQVLSLHMLSMLLPLQQIVRDFETWSSLIDL